MSRISMCVAALVCLVVLLVSGPRAMADGAAANVVLPWNRAVLQAVADARMAPPQVARALAIVHTSMYDAWAAYTDRAVGTRLGGGLRRPRVERTERHQAAALSHAAYRAAADLFPAREDDLFRPLMHSLGHVPEPETLDPASPAGVGNRAAAEVITFRHQDGANQLGHLAASGVPYDDYTGYTPVNDPWTLSDPTRWQPLQLPTGQPQRFLAPHWHHVIPFALTASSQFRPKPPAIAGTSAYLEQALAIVEMGAHLDDRAKALAIYWADGPGSVTPPGHWMLIAQAVSLRRGHTHDDDVRLFFTLANALLDASIAAWDCKVAYDSIRPVSAIRWLFAGQQIPTWRGGTIDGSNWQSYIPTPPFAEHVSGHSTFSAAAAEVLRWFTGRDTMAMHVVVPAGSSPVEPGVAPARDVILEWRTYSEAADAAGLSRLYGGIHFRRGDLEGRQIGRRVGMRAWQQAARYFRGHPHLEDPTPGVE
jgi:hypothetical protein